MISGITEINFNRDSLHIVVKNVPASICNNCGNKTLNAKVALYIDRIIQVIFEAEQPIRMREITLEAA
jgi:YgiT-type zinc finger domain-containing protein